MAKKGGKSYSYEKFSILRELLCKFKITKNEKNIFRLLYFQATHMSHDVCTSTSLLTYLHLAVYEDDSLKDDNHGNCTLITCKWDDDKSILMWVAWYPGFARFFLSSATVNDTF